MLKFTHYAVTFAEFPDEISLIFSISGCPNHCKGCSEPELQKDAGIPLTESIIKEKISEFPGITLIGFLGGDSNWDEIAQLANYIHSLNLKVGLYSGKDVLSMKLLNCLDYYKIGRWILPVGSVDSWWKTNCGPITFTFSNQLMFKKEGDIWANITSKFRDKPLNNLQKEVIQKE